MKWQKSQSSQLFHPIGTQCVIGVQLVRAKARRKLMHLSLRLAFYIRIELDRSNVDARSNPAVKSESLAAQGLSWAYTNFRHFEKNSEALQSKTSEIFRGSSQIVVCALCRSCAAFSNQSL